MAPPSVPSMPPLLTAAPAAIPRAVPIVSALVAQPERPTSEATSAIPIPDFSMALSVEELNCTESIGTSTRTTRGDGLLRLVTPLLLLVALPKLPRAVPSARRLPARLLQCRLRFLQRSPSYEDGALGGKGFDRLREVRDLRLGGELGELLVGEPGEGGRRGIHRVTAGAKAMAIF